jgi:tetratricopeptide (TPR) repeat protein
MCYKDRLKQVARIGREVHVDYIVEGGVHRTEDEVDINIQLILVRDQTHIFAQKYKAHPQDISRLQSNIAGAIAAHLNIPGLAGRVRLAVEDNVPATKQRGLGVTGCRRIDPDVHDLALKGKATLEYATREEQVHQAIELFQKAIDRDPTYAPPWAGLGEALWYLATTGFEFVAPMDVRDKAVAAADKSLEIDATLPDAQKARAVLAVDAEWDLVKAQHHFKRVLELRPGHATAHNLYGQILTVPLLRFDEARHHLDRARELDPLSPWNDANLLGWWIHQGRPEKTIQEGLRARQRNPTLWLIPCLMGFAHLLLGEAREAVREFQATLKLAEPARPSATLAPLGLAYGLAGRRSEALDILAELDQKSRKCYISPFYFAVVYSGLSQMEKGFKLLWQALDQRTPYMVFCTPNNGTLVALRRDPSWRAFSERLRQLVKLPPGSSDPYS